MRTLMTALLVGILLFGVSKQTAVSQNSGLAIPQSAIQEDPNLNPNWDWRLGDDPSRIYPDAAYTMYHKSDGAQIIPNAVSAPWTQGNAWTGLLDNKKEDGWELLAKDFGTMTRPITGLNVNHAPYFVLYNRHRSLLRFFIFVQKGEPWDKGVVELQFRDPSNTNKTPAVLAHFKPVAEAIDKFQRMKDNISSAYSDLMQMNVWLWADFPLSFDPTLIPKSDIDPPSFYFQIYGQNLSDIQIKGISTGASGAADFVNRFLTGALDGNGSFGIPNLRMPNLDVNPKALDVDLGNLSLKPFGTQTNWSSFTNYFSKIKIKIPSVDVSNSFKGLFDGFSAKLSSFTGALPFSLPGLDIGGLFDFFVNGGAKVQAPAEPAPSFIAMNLELAGTISRTTPVHKIRVTIPSTRDEYWKPTLGSPVGIVRNNPVGLLTLIKTPIVNRKKYESAPVEYQHEIFYKTFYEYNVAEDLQYSLNSASGLNLKYIEAELLFDYIIPGGIFDATQDLVLLTGVKNQRYLVDFEAPLGISSATFRSMPIPAKYLKGRTAQVPTLGSSQPRLKIKAVFTRKDDPSAQPVVFISTYNVDVVDQGITMQNGYSSPILPTIPPQNAICVVPATGGVRVSWDRNREKSINHYAVERSINSASYVQIGTTADTVFTDTEVQKAVKPYQLNRQNVSVSYRVRAKSEWIDDNGSLKSQYSAYSDAIAISGSIIRPLEKNSTSQVIPESNLLSQNFPNPFNPSTTIYYGVKEEGIVTIKIFNALGQEITSLVNEKKEVGYHYAEWNAVGLPSGMYFYKIQNGNYVETKRMVLTK